MWWEYFLAWFIGFVMGGIVIQELYHKFNKSNKNNKRFSNSIYLEKEIALKFIAKVKELIPFGINIVYEYDDLLCTHCIWHNIKPNIEMEYEKLLGYLIHDYFYKNGIYNVSFGYNLEKINKQTE